MNLQILSDLHLEFQRSRWKEFLESFDPKDVDVAVVAGDICTSSLLDRAIGSLCARFPEVVYVVGNHEYYGSSPRRVHGALASLRDALPNFHWLQNEVTELTGVRFAGTTLWFRDDPLNSSYEHALNDFALIRGFKPWVYDENERALEFLAKEVPSVDVVVTHHLPSQQSVAPAFEDDPLNRFFLCDIDELIRQGKPALWIHGHTHVSIDCRLGETQVLCNPLGYVPWHNPDFDHKLVVRVPGGRTLT
jgi:Icc-related predicted phosphoesterase